MLYIYTYVAVSCSVLYILMLQCIAVACMYVCCSALQCIVYTYVAVYRMNCLYICIAVYCSVFDIYMLQCIAVCCMFICYSVLQYVEYTHVTVYYSELYTYSLANIYLFLPDLQPEVLAEEMLLPRRSRQRILETKVKLPYDGVWQRVATFCCV